MNSGGSAHLATGRDPPLASRCGLALITFALLASPFVTHSRTDPDTGRIRVIFLGEVKPAQFPFPSWIEAEPKFTLRRVPCDIEWFSETDARRFARLYLPRTYKDLVDHYDAIIFEDFTLRILPEGTLERFQKAIGEDGLGIALVEYVYWSGNLNEIDRWMQSSFYDVFAADVVFGSATDVGRRFYEVLRKEPIFGVPDISKWAMNGASHGDLRAREGATVEAIWSQRKTEAVVTRSYGKGSVIQISHGWDNIPSETVIGYEYLPDLIFNELFFTAKVAPPEDLAMVHTIRVDLIQIAQRRESAVALLDFVDRFGANTARLERMLGDLDGVVKQAEKDYILSRYAEAQEALQRATEGYARFSDSAVDLKNRAMIWIYVIEWITVAATLMICLEAVWILMVRRRLYRAVHVTRAVG